MRSRCEHAHSMARIYLRASQFIGTDRPGAANRVYANCLPGRCRRCAPSTKESDQQAYSITCARSLAAAARPRASLAQQARKVWRVGFLSLNPASESSQNTAAFRKGLRDLGYIEGKNLIIEWRFAEGSFE